MLYLLGAGWAQPLVPDARTEVAAALYAASATQAASLRAADASIRTLRAEIERLRSEGRQHVGQLAEAQEQYVAALAVRDRAYAEEIAVFRQVVQDIATTPEGVAALARFNAGDEVGALAILDDLRVARDAARQRRTNIESAAEGRRIATLALDARGKGRLGTAPVIARFEEVTRLDPGVQWDWVELARLYRDIGNLSAALRAGQEASNRSTTDRDRLVSHGEIGNVLVAQGDGPGALAAYRRGLSIAEALAAATPRTPSGSATSR